MTKRKKLQDEGRKDSDMSSQNISPEIASPKVPTMDPIPSSESQQTVEASTGVQTSSSSNEESRLSEKQERKSAYPDPNEAFSLAHDNLAGVRLSKHDRFKQMQLGFREFSEPLHEELTNAGWKFRPDEDIYTKQYGDGGAALAIVEAKRLYVQLVDRIIDGKGEREGLGR